MYHTHYLKLCRANSIVVSPWRLSLSLPGVAPCRPARSAAGAAACELRVLRSCYMRVRDARKRMWGHRNFLETSQTSVVSESVCHSPRRYESECGTELRNMDGASPAPQVRTTGLQPPALHARRVT